MVTVTGSSFKSWNLFNENKVKMKSISYLRQKYLDLMLFRIFVKNRIYSNGDSTERY
jgi:hypothetical protein